MRITHTASQAAHQRKHPKAQQQLSFARDTLWFSGARVLGAFLSLARSFLLAKYLGPEVYGTWQFVNLFTNYAPYASLGTQSALSRRIPFLRGKGDIVGQQAVLGTAFATHVFSSLSYSLIIVVCSFFISDVYNAETLLFFSPVILLLSWLHYTKLLALSCGLFRFGSNLQILHDLTSGIFSVLLIYFFGLLGVIVAFALSALLAVIVSLIRLYEYLIFKFDLKVLFDLIITGIPLMANGFLITLSSTVDRFMISFLLGTSMLGIYSIANIGVNVLRIIPVSVAQLLVVRFSEMAGKEKSKEAVVDSIDKYTSFLSCSSSVLISVGISFFPLIIVFLLPKFVEGIPAGRILIADIFFLSISLPITNWCMSIGNYKPVLTLRMITVLLEIALIYVVIYSGAALEYIAICVITGSAIYAISIWVIAVKMLELAFEESIRRMVRIFLPFVPIIFEIFMQTLAFRGDYFSSKSDVLLASMIILVITNIFITFITLITNKRMFSYLGGLIAKRVA